MKYPKSECICPKIKINCNKYKCQIEIKHAASQLFILQYVVVPLLIACFPKLWL